MVNVSDVYQYIADVNLWMKVKNGDSFALSDFPIIIPLRWTYIKNNWEFIKVELLNRSDLYFEPDFLKQQIKDFSEFVESQRESKLNPLQDANTFFRFIGIFDNMFVQDIALTNEEEDLIQREIDRINLYTKNDFVLARKKIREYRDRLADYIGLKDDDYNKVYNRSSISQQVNATVVDLNYLLQAQKMIKTIDFLLANLYSVDLAVDPFAIARANANNPEINIGQYSSGRLVRLNYGESLQSLAERYLGDPDKWIDIAIANGLKPPYIDEVGQSIPLLSNGNGNFINLAETDINGNLNIDKLYINQPVFLSSSTQVLPDQRSIVNITQVPVSGEIIIELDGPANLDIYKTADNAAIRVFAPNTINSSFYILIPSTEEIPEDRKNEVPWFLSKSSEDEKKAGIDLAIDPQGDLIFTPNSDVKLSYGLENAIQAMKLKLTVELGSLHKHPDFGFPNFLGEKTSSFLLVREKIRETLERQISKDPRFDYIETMSIEFMRDKNNPEKSVNAISISLSVKLAGGNTVIPISFSVNYR